MVKGKSDKHHTKAYIESIKHEYASIKEKNTWVKCGEVLKPLFKLLQIFMSLIMAGTGDGGGEYHQLDESQRLLLDVMTTQMQRLQNWNNEKHYGRIEGLEN